MRPVLTTIALLASVSTSFAEPSVRSQFARSGDLEVGASAGGMLANDLRIFNAAASVGWFVSDEVALSCIIGVASMAAEDRERAVVTALVEPALMPKLGEGVHGLFGFGIGAAYVGTLGAGAAIAPRVGLKLRAGDAGIVTPAVAFEHVFNNVEEDRMNPALDAALSSVRFSVGYSMFW